MSICKAPDCRKYANYGPPGGVVKYCAKHKAVDHIDLKKPHCIHAGCNKKPNYGPAKGKAEWCAAHKQPEHIDLKHRRCAYAGCTKIPNYGPPTGRAIYCVAHKAADHINRTQKSCQPPGCTIQPSFGPVGGKAMWCTTHKEEGHVDLHNAHCTYAGCSKIPTFGPIGGKPQWCVAHKMEEHINLKQQLCQYVGCKKQPRYGPVDGDAVRCAEHKIKDHVDLKIKHCQHPGCTVNPHYGPVDGTATWCSVHKQIGDVDLKHTKCKHAGCVKTANYGRPFQTKSHCAEHRTHGMYLKNRPMCPCGDKQPCWTNEESNYPIRCEKCKTETDRNVVDKKCETCGLTGLIREDFADCDDCAEFQLKKPLKTRELLVKAILDEAKMPYKSHDKIPEESCHRYRPDFLFDWGTHIVILEVDEDQHRGYACECEQARMINLFQDQGGMKTLFIRFNPDNYRDRDSKLNKWSTSRGPKLLDIIRQTRDHPPEHILSAVHLYYDGFDTNKVEFVKLEYGL